MELRLKVALKLTFVAITAVAVIQVISMREAIAEEGGLDAHVHGMSDLTIAIEGTEIEIEFESPAINIVGFEYQAQSPNDINSVKEAVISLNDHNAVFTFSDTTCRLIDSSVNVTGVLGDVHDDHDAHEEQNTDAHSDVAAAYHFNCDDLSRLSEIQVHLFRMFPGIDEIRTMWLKEGKQGAVNLTAESPTVKLD
ncbi:DUF2796 domain-containing protein [Burkholderiales bacterium]|nr:DUF2796 domain-containing protein [Burkholderiales bacterium]